jgi:hypothetical protein
MSIFLRDQSGTPDERQLTRYLLGLLPDRETERFDEASVADDEFAARLRIAETDLVDSYVVGHLDGETLKRFESHYLSSPRRRRNVTFAIGFLAAINRAAPAESVRNQALMPLSVPPSWRRSLLPARPVVAAALCFVVCGTLLFHFVNVRDDLRVVPSETSAPKLARGPDESPAPQPARPGPNAALVLLPQTRAVGPVPGLSVPADAEHASVELRLDSNEFARYEVELKDPASNQIVWRSGPLDATTSDQTAAVSVLVPARLLKPQHYSLTVMGRRENGAEVVGSYAFQIRR